jgi:putative Mn2+ efflux pump MntP
VLLGLLKCYSSFEALEKSCGNSFGATKTANKSSDSLKSVVAAGLTKSISGVAIGLGLDHVDYQLILDQI